MLFWATGGGAFGYGLDCPAGIERQALIPLGDGAAALLLTSAGSRTLPVTNPNLHNNLTQDSIG